MSLAEDLQDWSSAPVPKQRLTEIVNEVCDATFASANGYDHSHVSSWNTNIINTTLQSLISEVSAPSQQPSFKFVVTSTIMEQQNPASYPRTHSSNEPTQSSSSDNSITGGNAGSAAGKRGMHSATGAYWNKQQDGMWSLKYEKQESKGFDVIVTVIWVAMV